MKLPHPIHERRKFMWYVAGALTVAFILFATDALYTVAKDGTYLKDKYVPRAEYSEHVRSTDEYRTKRDADLKKVSEDTSWIRAHIECNGQSDCIVRKMRNWDE